jgi:hypothetical protein
MALDDRCFQRLREASKTGVNPKGLKLPNALAKRLLACVPSSANLSSSRTHDIINFRPVSRFHPVELQQACVHLCSVKEDENQHKKNWDQGERSRYEDNRQVNYPLWTRKLSEGITPGKVRKQYKLGRPMVLSDIDIRCTPEDIVKNSLEKSCTIVNCETGQERRTTLAEFFKGFQEASETSEKVKVRRSHAPAPSHVCS